MKLRTDGPTPLTDLRQPVIHFSIFLIALLAGTVGGVIGTGSSLILLPVLVHAYEPRAAMPIMAIAALIGNFSRMIAWWRLIDWRAATAYALPGVPAAALGAHTLLALPAWTVEAALGLFFWCLLPIRRRLRARQRRLSLAQLGLCGAVIGFLTGLVLSTGPLSVPAFMIYGLSGGAFLGTEATASLLLYAGKLATFGAQDALPLDIVLYGLLVGAGITAGTVLSKPLVLRLPARAYEVLLDGLLLIAGAAMLASAWRAV